MTSPDPTPLVDDDGLVSPSLMQLKEVEIRLQDALGDIRVAVSRQGAGLAVQLHAPRAMLPELRALEGEVGHELAEDGQQLDSYDAAPDPEQEPPNPGLLPPPARPGPSSSTAPQPSGSGRLVNRVV